MIGIFLSGIGMGSNKNKGCAIGGLVTSIIGLVLGAVLSFLSSEAESIFKFKKIILI